MRKIICALLLSAIANVATSQITSTSGTFIAAGTANLGLLTNTTPRLTVIGSGTNIGRVWVGTGTPSPADLLHVNGIVRSTQLNLTGGILNTIGATNLSFRTNGTTQMTLSTNGNLGIGTSAPASAYKLDVNGNGRFNAGLDVGGARNSNSSLGSLTVIDHTVGNYNSFQFAQSGFGGSHAILFNGFKAATQVNGDLTAIGNIKYANDVGPYSSGAGMIHFLGNGGRMDFYISPESTGTNTNINWQNTPVMSLNRSGAVMIGTWNPGSYKLAVAGKIAAWDEIKVFTNGSSFPDYVFDTDYRLPSLEETETYIKENHHLPEVPSATEIAKDGMSLNGMSEILLKKVEELTLHLIEMKKESNQMKEQNDLIKKENEELKRRLEALENKK
jgi:hypothetical protein